MRLDTRALIRLLLAVTILAAVPPAVAETTAPALPTLLFLGVENRHGEPAMHGVERRATALLDDAFARSRRFQLIDRKTAAGLLKQPTVAEADLAALRTYFPTLRYLVAGDLTGNNLASEITLRFIDAATGAITQTLRASHITTPHVEPLARQLFLAVRNAFPLTGQIIQIQDSKVYVDLGAEQGLIPGETLSVWRVERIGERIIDQEEIGRLVLKKVTPQAAWGEFAPRVAGTPATVGLTVQTQPAAPAPTGGDQPQETIIALQPFENRSGEASLSYLGDAIAENLTTRLTGLKGFKLVDRLQLDQQLNEQRLQSSALFDPALTVASGRLWSPRYIVGGSFQKLGDHYRIDARMKDVQTGESLRAESLIGEDILRLPDTLGDLLINALNRQPDWQSTRVTGIQVEIRHVRELPTAIYHLLPGLKYRILEVRLQNTTTTPQRLVVRTAIQGYTQDASDTVDIEPGQARTLYPYPAFLTAKLTTLLTDQPTAWTLHITRPDGAQVFEKTLPLQLLARDTLLFQHAFLDEQVDLLAYHRRLGRTPSAHYWQALGRSGPAHPIRRVRRLSGNPVYRRRPRSRPAPGRRATRPCGHHPPPGAGVLRNAARPRPALRGAIQPLSHRASATGLAPPRRAGAQDRQLPGWHGAVRQPAATSRFATGDCPGPRSCLSRLANLA